MDAPFNEDEMKTSVNSIITYVINGASTKLPIKERDIMQTIDKKGKLFNAALQSVKEILKEVAVPESKGGKCYICFSEDSGKSLLMHDEKQKRQLVLLFIILSFIFMRTTTSIPNITETHLQNFLKTLHVDFDVPHEYFGSNIRKLITDTFVKQLYLKREKSNSDLETEIKFCYSWGYRAHQEFDKKCLLLTTAQIMKKPAKTFGTKYDEVCKDEEDAV
uniref:MAGE domain-containing protein n=1 Tax=Glossina morsitans morsitans TaxID=37546 RepID=A0A1B0FB37_GLOMM